MNYRTLICFLSVSLVTGCASFDAITTQNRTRLNQLSVGMNKPQVLSVMGTETIKTGGSPEIVTNPYKSETFRNQSGKTHEVLFYYTDVKRRDGVVTDDELTPLVLEDGKLIGWGNSFFSDVKKVEVRIR